MQVSHHNDHITHAVIGGKQAIEFGISTSAEFFNILSSTLYKDQILAVVREVLCNAWDAHIEAQCTDRPVVVTLTNDTFSIKDFGNGIHHDDMGLIYGTYGNSTKKNDGNQTGGFGLGCKAPFAYTNHFEVVSCCSGIKTIYSLSKSSAQAMGKPGITPIASFPTEESGLTVSIRIKPSDYARFRELITRIAYNGDMNIQLNETQLETLNFDVSQGNFLLTRNKLLGAYHAILVRYGNVVYPVEAFPEGHTDYHAILSHLNTLKGPYSPYSLVFQAPAHSIAVTPSRESLSMQEHTVNTLKTLFQGFLDGLETTFKPACVAYAQSVTQQAVATKRVDQLLKRQEEMPFLESFDVTHNISAFDVMARTFLHLNYPQGMEYRKADVSYRLNTMVQNNLLDRGKVQTFLRELSKSKVDCSGRRAWYVGREKNHWLQRQVIAPLLTRLAKAGLPTQKLFSCSSEDERWKRNGRQDVALLVPATCASPFHLLSTLPFLRNIVVITTTRRDLVNRAYQHEVFKTAGKYQGYLVYIAGTKKGELEAVRQFFAQTGMRVADLTLNVTAPVRAPVTCKPAKKGIPKLTTILNGTRIDITRFTREDAERIEDPEFVLQVSLRSGNPTNYIPGWSHSNSTTLLNLFGHKGGITNNTATYDKYIAKGAVRFDEYVHLKICKYILDNPRIKSYWAYSKEHLGNLNDHASQLVTAIYSNEALFKEFGLINPLTDEDRVYLNLWDGVCKNSSSRKEVKEVQSWLASIAPAPEVQALAIKLTFSWIKYLNTDELRRAFQNSTDVNFPKLVAILNTFLNP